MKAIILAAGEGKRLRPYTDNQPKCMVPFRGKPITNYILDAMHKCGIDDITIVAGYKMEVLKNHLCSTNVKFYFNGRYDCTNMVYSLFCAEQELDHSDVIISYSDIIYSHSVLKSLIESTADISVVVDQNWKKLWEIRMDDPLTDAETLKMDESGNILELGKKPWNYSDIEGQYMGLIKLSKNVLSKVISFYNSLDKQACYDGKNFENMFMTSFIQLVIDRLMPVKGVIIQGGWLEIDSIQDLDRYRYKSLSALNLDV